jgi:hypothetical protein
MIDRKDLIKEQLLRENIRKAIRIVKERQNQKEGYVRTIVRYLLKEATIVKYEYTALNLLAHFIKEVVGDPSKPDSNPAFKDAFTDLTSGIHDRELFTEYILGFADEDFKTIDADREPKPLGQEFVEKGFVDDEEEMEELTPEEDEVITVSVGDLEGRGGDLTADPEEEEEEIFTLGEDGEFEEEEEDADSGIKKYSREAYKRVGPSLRRYYSQVQKDSPLKKGVEIDGKEYQPGQLSERELFRIYFQKNLILWAERYEDEFFTEEPEIDVDFENDSEFEGEEDLGLGL